MINTPSNDYFSKIILVYLVCISSVEYRGENRQIHVGSTLVYFLFSLFFWDCLLVAIGALVVQTSVVGAFRGHVSQLASPADSVRREGRNTVILRRDNVLPKAYTAQCLVRLDLIVRCIDRACGREFHILVGCSRASDFLHSSGILLAASAEL